MSGKNGPQPAAIGETRSGGWLERARRVLGEGHFAEHWAKGQMADLRGQLAELLSDHAEPVPNDSLSDLSLDGGLTREREVATLVGRGLSTRAIADELVIAEDTAKVHVARILSKLGLHSRAQLAIWAVQNGLVPHPC